MGKIKLCIVAVILSSCCLAQSDIVRTGLLRAQLTYSPGIILESNTSHYYLHGNLEGYVSNKISIAGEGYYYLTNGGINTGNLSYNHSGFFGASYHFGKKMNDFYIGLQPGISVSKFSNSSSGIVIPQQGINPVLSTTIGYNLYFFKYFHFFVQGRFIVGEHNYYPTHSLNEFRFSAGLGFNVNTLKSSL
jgi:hypothetical protein